MGVIVEAIEAAGSVAAMVAELEQERDLLQLDPNGDVSKGFKVMGRGMDDHAKYTELAR